MPYVSKLGAINTDIAVQQFGLYVEGTNLNDTLYGSEGPDSIHGLSGADVLYGRGGNDSMFGDDGNDWLFGGSGDDHLDGGMGNDVLDGGAGADALVGSDGFDTASYAAAMTAVYANLATNTGLYGDAQGDTYSGIEKLVGSSFSDQLVANDAGNALEGGAGNDYLIGGAGIDGLNGGAGNDTLEGGRGIDVLTGGSGTDFFVFHRDDGPDVVTDFQQSVDKVFLSGFSSPFGLDGELARGTDVPLNGGHGGGGYGGRDQVFFDTDDHVLYQLNGFTAPTMLATFGVDVDLHTSDFLLSGGFMMV